MNLTKMITESVINETLNITSSELDEIKKVIIERMIIEGVDDPGILKCVFMAGGPGCFVGDTLVKTSTGYKPISTIKEGELVYTINEITKEIELKSVIKTHLYEEHTEDLLELEFDTGDIVKCTENHLFYVDNKWVKAKDLVVE